MAAVVGGGGARARRGAKPKVRLEFRERDRLGVVAVHPLVDALEEVARAILLPDLLR